MGPGPTAAPSNTSIATAIALPAADARYAIPCGAALYFGPFQFSASPSTITIHAHHASRSGEQACAGASWVDGADVVIDPAGGIGCPEAAGPAKSTMVYTYQPESGASSANPVYLKLSAEAAYCGKSDVTLSLE